jgi:hypothetical protein
MKSLWWFAVVVLFLAVAAAPVLRAAENPPPALREEDNTDSKTTELELNKDYSIEVKGLSAYAHKQSPPLDLGKLVLYLDGTGMGIHAEPAAVNSDKLSFRLERSHTANPSRDEESRKAWSRVLGSPRGPTRSVVVRVGFEGQPPLEGEITRTLRIIHLDWLFWISLGGFALALGLFAWLATVTNIIRESGPAPNGKRKAFSLGRSQMAFWFFLVLASYLGILLITREQSPIPSQVLGLMGIATITALGSAAVDISRRSTAQEDLPRLLAQKTQAEAAVAAVAATAGAAATAAGGGGAAAAIAPASAAAAWDEALTREIRESKARLVAAEAQDFWRDLLSDADGISLHRFQIVVWTIVLGAAFVVIVYQYLAMPEFDSSLLLLMGISAGAYLGFKIPEKAAETKPSTA